MRKHSNFIFNGLQVEEKFYELMTAHGLTEKAYLSAYMYLYTRHCAYLIIVYEVTGRTSLDL